LSKEGLVFNDFHRKEERSALASVHRKGEGKRESGNVRLPASNRVLILSFKGELRAKTLNNNTDYWEKLKKMLAHSALNKLTLGNQSAGSKKKLGLKKRSSKSFG